MKLYILGGGPAGLAIAHGIVKDSEIPFVLIERAPTVGGLAQTLRWGKHGSHDLGPHKIFTKDKALMARVEGLLPEGGWLTRPKYSRIYMRGRFLSYPPSPFGLLRVYGPLTFGRMVIDYATARIVSSLGNKVPRTFEEDLVGRVGRRLYEALFKPIALKLWGDPTQLDAKLSQARVQTPSLAELVGRLLKIRSSSDFEALSFRYPKGGLSKIWEAILAKTQHQGTYLVNQEVTAIRLEKRTVCMIRHKDRITNAEKQIQVGEEDFVFSTLPLGKLLELMGDGIPPGTARSMKEVLQLNDLILVFFKIDSPSLLEESWIFVPDPDIVFQRVSEQESFDPDMTGDGSIVCCEIMSSDMRPMSALTDHELLAAAKEGLAKMGFNGFSAVDQRVIRLPASYPVFRSGYERVLERILDELDEISNFRTVGRQGAFQYIGTLDAMDIGYGAARWLVHQGTNRRGTWKEERQRSSHYPILD